jgi:hypothetical protein
MSGRVVNISGVFQIELDTHPVHFIWTVNGSPTQGVLELRPPDGLILCTITQDAGADRPLDKPPADFTPGPEKSVIVYRRARP